MIKHLFRHLLPVRSVLLFFVYGAIFVWSLWLGFQMRFDFAVPETYRQLFFDTWWWIVVLKLTLLFGFGQFGGLLSYFRLPDLYRIFTALGTVAIFLTFMWFIYEVDQIPPRSVILFDFIMSFTLVCAFRVGLRVTRERFFSSEINDPKNARRVAIVGAGDAGAQIAADLLAHRGHGMRPVVFLDDNEGKLRHHIHGIMVVDTPDNLGLVQKKFGIEDIVIAMPSASPSRIGEIVRRARELGIKAEIVPSLQQLTSGRVKASRVRPVDIGDLLGREQVPLDSENISQMIAGKVVMVTGAGGSIGSELCRQICTFAPDRLLLVEQCEVQIFQTEQMLIEEGFSGVFTPLVADILDENRMRQIFERFAPQVVFHAAAHKHVYMMERQPGEAIKNNSIGTEKLADLSAEYQVERFVLISTDKAINPTNIMGASKRLAEIYLQARQKENGGPTRFMAVRFGNVLGSSGSVVPIFKKQIAAGGPVKVTHEEVTRYFMTIPEAVGLVLQSATQGSGGEIFVLDMGEPVKIADLAKQMIILSGFRPEIDIEIEYIGLRPGEKLYEELQHDNERHTETQHPRIFRFRSEPKEAEAVRTFLRELEAKLYQLEPSQIKAEVKALVPEYKPYVD